MASPWICWLEECGQTDVAKVGGKCASLGELTRTGSNVPPGFAVTVDAYREFVRRNGLGTLLQEMTAVTDEQASVGEQGGGRLRRLVLQAPLPADLREAIAGAYRELELRTGQPGVAVAVRSSAIGEDAAQASFAGQHETYLNVSGGEEVCRRVQECWGSLFSAPALSYRQLRGGAGEEAAMAVAVQQMVDARVSGVMFTVDPVSGDPSRIVVEGAWGLGEGIVSGYVTPDHFAVQKETLAVLEEWISPKLVEFVRDSRVCRTVQQEVPSCRQQVPALQREELLALARLAARIEQHYGRPQDIEWALDRLGSFPANLKILQSRPVTTWGNAGAL